MASQDKNNRIRATRAETIQRHAAMTCRVYSCKIQDNKLNAKQREALKMMFVEAKWFRNYVLAWSQADSNNKISKFDTKLNAITHKDKDRNDIAVDLKHLPESVRQTVCTQMLSDIKSLKAKKAQHKKVGQLHFVKAVNSLDFKQFGTTHKIVSSRRVKLAGIKKPVVVHGLDQFIGIPGIEIANAKLICNPQGYYIKFTTFSPKDAELEHNGKIISIDFGCSTAFTTNEGEKIEASVQESERLKKMVSRNNNRLIMAFIKQFGHKPDFNNKADAHNFKTMKRSENWKRENRMIRKEYQKLSNQKEDLANKIVAKLKEYDIIVIQDEMLKTWQAGNHGKKVQHSVLGRVKAKLFNLPNTVVLSQSLPTTKMCTSCGKMHPEMKNLNKRIFECHCDNGNHIKEDRDVHAAQNMIWFYNNNIGVGRTKLSRAEIQRLVDEAIANSNQAG